MLRNKTNSPVVVKWNDDDQIVPANSEFNVSSYYKCSEKEASILEAFFIQKHPDALERVPGTELKPHPSDPGLQQAPEDPKAPEAQETPGPKEGATDLKPVEDMKKDELRQELVEAGITDGWDGDTKKDQLANLVRENRAAAPKG